MKKVLAILICMSMVLSLVCVPASAETVKPTQKSMLYYAADGSISVGSSYSEWKNLWIKFKYNGGNSLMQIAAFYQDGKNTQKPTSLWDSTSSDWVGPLAFLTDTSTDTTNVWTGGNHPFTDAVSAITESVTVKLDGVVQTRPAAGAEETKTGDVVEITVVNKIKAGNNPSGDYALQETVVYTVYDNTIDVVVSMKALEGNNVTIKSYMGLQSCNGSMFTEKVEFRNGQSDSTNGGTDYYPYMSGTKAGYPNVDQAIHRSANGDVMKMTLDRTYGIGSLEYLAATDHIANTSKYNKTYFHLVSGIPCSLKAGESVGWKGQYKFEKESSSVTTDVTPLFFDDFSTQPGYITDSTYENDADDAETVTYHTVTTTAKNGKLYLDRNEKQDNNFGGFSIPASKIGADKYTNGNKFVIEYDFYSSESAYPYIYTYINDKATGYGYGDVNDYNKANGTSLPKSTVNGRYTIVYDRVAGTATCYPPESSPFEPKSITGISSNDGNINLEFRIVDSSATKTENTLDYVAVYPLADSFSAELSDVSSTGAILKTNMPISTKNAALKVGENNVTVVKEANSVNTYKLAFETPLSGGSFTLAGKVNALAYATNVDVNIDFDYEFEFEKAEALYFDNFDRALADGKSEVFAASVNSTWAKYFPIISRESGKLKISNTEDLNYAAFSIPESAIKNHAATSFVIEYDLDINSSYAQNMVSVDGTNFAGFYDNKNTGGVVAEGKHYAIFDSTAKTLSLYYPDGTEPVVVNTAAITGENLSAEFKLTTYKASHSNTYDYIAVYPLNETFDGSVVNSDTKMATLLTNMPLDLTRSTFKLGNVNATVTAKDNTYNEYTIVYGEEIAKGDYTLEVSAVPLGGTETQTKSLDFTCSKDPLRAGYYDDFSVIPEEMYFTSTSTAGRMQDMTVTAGQLEVAKKQSSNWAEFTIPANKINAALSEADKFIIQWNTSYTSGMAAQRIAINGSAWEGAWYGHANEEVKEVPEGTYTVIYDRANNSASYYYPGCTEPITMADIPAATAAEGFDVQFQTITYYGSTSYDYIRVWPLEGNFEYSISDVTEKKALLTTSLPIDPDTAMIQIGEVDCAVETYPTAPNKYILTPSTALTVGNEHEVLVDAVKSIDGKDLTPAAHTAVVPVAGKTEITGIAISTDANGRKVAKITGTNNIIDASPLFVIAEYADADASWLSHINMENAILPVGEFSTEANGVSLLPSNIGVSYGAYVFDNLSNLLPIK